MEVTDPIHAPSSSLQAKRPVGPSGWEGPGVGFLTSDFTNFLAITKRSERGRLFQIIIK